MNKPIHVAIVGCGRIADMHAPGYKDRDDATLLTETNLKIQ